MKADSTKNKLNPCAIQILKNKNSKKQTFQNGKFFSLQMSWKKITAFDRAIELLLLIFFLPMTNKSINKIEQTIKNTKIQDNCFISNSIPQRTPTRDREMPIKRLRRISKLVPEIFFDMSIPRFKPMADLEKIYQ